MSDIDLAEGAVNVNAAIIAADLGLRPDGVLGALRDGRLTAVCEKGVDQHSGQWRLTFYHEGRRLQLIVDQSGRVLERSAARRRLRRRPSGDPRQTRSS